MTGKKSGCWTCKKCATRYTQLHRQWGGWPPSEWESFSEEEKTAFWVAVGAAETKEDQDKVVMEVLSKKVEEIRSAGSGGKYLPLSVYERKGFDIAKIERECDDYKELPMLGLC